MNTTSYYMKVTALNPISHIGKTASTGALFNTEKVNGRDVPYITGAAGKGILRRIGMDVMLSMLGLDPEAYGENIIQEHKDVLTQERLEVLFNGSILRSTGNRSVDVSQGAKLAELIPWFAVVGGCLGNTMMQGRISVGPMTLICEENRGRLEMMEKHINKRVDIKPGEPETAVAILPTGTNPARHYLQRQEFSHNDDFNRLGSRAATFLPPQQQQAMIAAKTMDFLDRQEPDWQDEETGNHVQMRFSVQTLTAGCEFFWRIDTFDFTPLMEDAFMTTFGHFLARPYIGGMRRMGMGLIDVKFLGRSRVEPVKAEWSTAVTVNRTGDLYAKHLTERRDEIIKLLEVLGK